MAEVCRPSPSATPSDVARMAADYVAWGADAIAVPTDLEQTSGGLQDLFAVCRAVKVPVLQWDWFLHPLQASQLFHCMYALQCWQACCTAGLCKNLFCACPCLHEGTLDVASVQVCYDIPDRK